MLQVTETSHIGFPSITVRTKHYEVSAVPGIGGRIAAFGANGVNLLYRNESLAGYRPAYEAANADEMRALRERGPILLYGGEKTWLAPQADWGGCPYADLDHGEYELRTEREGDAVRLVLTSPVCRETRLQIIRTITCADDDPRMEIEQRLVNHGTAAVTKGLWQVTMLNRDGIVDVPDGEGVKAERPVPMLRAENAPAAREAGGWRLKLGDNTLFKLGFMTDAGQTAARHTGPDGERYTLVKTFDVAADRAYPHHTVVEVYNAEEYPYYELEVHSPAYTLQPGESAAFTVRWELLRPYYPA
ncbi:DUF4380 domain-containing protein [Paenibacillus arenilitoris]|uniref:DUF4380 domain-containing protein n=1 Tax=Paenibacillus arenilitoris TaxID=2772299 RepID=A0A927CFN2_9BACL|nr:DUF4380 domain-containing protein [Paenibacillus arenilitoris]MBD2867208.1 DUF4380 domain-containing protein [Paenibacillus arenilitoris]